MNYRINKNLLSKNNAKTIKGEKMGITTYIMYLSPYTQNSKGINLCSHASEGCAKSCLFNSGAARFEAVQGGKLNKTEWFLANRNEFMFYLDKQIGNIYKATKGKNIAIRLNGTSDIRFEKIKVRDNKNIFELYPEIQFYDYTKNWLRFDIELPSNYHLTFSRSEDNHNKAIELLNRGINVAMVFDSVPSTYEGFEVINGDETDLRFKDKKGGVIVGLRYKKATGKGGREKNISALSSDFIIKLTNVMDKYNKIVKAVKKKSLSYI